MTTGGITVESGGAFHIGFSGNATPANAAVATGAMQVTVDGDMNVRGDTWVGKFDTAFFTSMMGLYKDFPGSPTDQNITLNITGNLNVDIPEVAGGHTLDGLMICAGNVMRSWTAPLGGGDTRVVVDGDTVVTGGGNHLAGTAGNAAILETRTFTLAGGDIEVIGAKTVLRTTAADPTADAVRIGGNAKMTLMRGATLDLRRGGNLLITDEGALSGNTDNGFVHLASGAKVLVDSGATIESLKGSLTLTDTVSQSSTLTIDGTIALGNVIPRNSTQGAFYSITGDIVTVTDSAKFTVAGDFLKDALTNYTDREANATVLSANTSLTIAGMADQETKALVDNVYHSLYFRQNGNALTFLKAAATDFGNAQAIRAAADRQTNKIYAANGINPANIASGLTENVARLAAVVHANGSDAPVYDPANGGLYVTKDTSAAGALNWDFLKSIAGDVNTFSSGVTADSQTHVILNSAFAGLYNNNRGGHINAIAMNNAGLSTAAVSNRITDIHRALAGQNAAGSADALASCILSPASLNRVWAGALGTWEDADERKGISGYRLDSYGVIAGYDRVIGGLTLGGAFGYTRGDYEDKAASAHDSDIDSYTFSLYSAYRHHTGLFASVTGAYSYADNDINEYDGSNWNREDFHSSTWNIEAKMGYEWNPFPCLTLTPSAGIAYVTSKNSDHRVEYNGMDLVRYRNMKGRRTYLPLELAASYRIPTGVDSTLTIDAKAGYAYALNEAGIEGTIHLTDLGNAAALRASDRTPGKHTLNLGAGLRYTHAHFDLGMNYDYHHKAAHNAHRLTGTIGIRF